jgi:hypothetical protein
VVTNSISGCTAEVEVEVFENTTPPDAVANVPGVIDCQETTQTLDGTGSSTGNNFSYEWTAVVGNIVSGNTTLNDCIVDSTGSYVLIVTDDGNGCTATDTIAVEEQINRPLANAGATDSID